MALGAGGGEVSALLLEERNFWILREGRREDFGQWIGGSVHFLWKRSAFGHLEEPSDSRVLEKLVQHSESRK